MIGHSAGTSPLAITSQVQQLVISEQSLSSTQGTSFIPPVVPAEVPPDDPSLVPVPPPVVSAPVVPPPVVASVVAGPVEPPIVAPDVVTGSPVVPVVPGPVEPAVAPVEPCVASVVAAVVVPDESPHASAKVHAASPSAREVRQKP